MMRTILGVLAGAALLTACGGSDPGSGTQTLYVEATASSDGSSQGTSITVLVRDGGAQGSFLQNATVTVIGDRGTNHALPFVGVFGIGAYHKSNFNWEGGWRLKIVNGNDNLEAYVAGPGLTTITAPTANSTFSKASAQNLSVQWRDDMGRTMPNADIDFRRANIDRTVQDTGSYSVDYNSLVVATDEQITVTRWTELNLRGGVTGSRFRAETKAELDLIVAQ
jgi:hypothetical protein